MIEPQPEVVSGSHQETATSEPQPEVLFQKSQPETISPQTAQFSLSARPIRTAGISIQEGRRTSPIRTGPSIDPMDKGKGQMPPPPPPPLTAVEQEVHLILKQVIKAVDSQMESFKIWYEHRTVVSFKTILEEGNLEELAVLEDKMLE